MTDDSSNSADAVLAAADGVDAELVERLARSLWNHPEPAYREHESADSLAAALTDAGFSVERGVGGLETAFVARYAGSTSPTSDGDDSDTNIPTVGILGEYDALPGMSQQVRAERAPVAVGAPGHACGHNLLGAAGVGAVVAVAQLLDAEGVNGEIRYYGCPAEETLAGKAFMARTGVFDDLDVALTWHPGWRTTPTMASTLALDAVEFVFHGETAHAAVSPEDGRSALDAVQLMNTGVEYLREHVPDDVRIHYAVSDGGAAPNVVPERAAVRYFVRAPERVGVDRVRERIDDVADGAALMTGTTVERHVETACYPYLPNAVVGERIEATMRALGPVGFTDEDRAFADELRATLDEERVDSRLDGLPEDARNRVGETTLYGEPIPAYDAGRVKPASTDVGDVSHAVPLAQFRGAAWPVGTPVHTWQATAASGELGVRGAVYAARVLAGTTVDLLLDTDARRRAREAFETTTDGRFVSALPDDATVPSPRDS